MQILEKNFIYKLKGNTIFLVAYSFIFLFIYKAFPFIAPFFLGTLIAFMIKPISQKLYNKFKINKGIYSSCFGYYTYINGISKPD